nr:hypothetical protein Iba_chr15bCG2620 [Ipomoea batatas]
MVYCITSTRKLSGKLQSLTMITISRLKLIFTSRLKAAHFAHSNSTPQQQSLFILPFSCKFVRDHQNMNTTESPEEYIQLGN